LFFIEKECCELVRKSRNDVDEMTNQTLKFLCRFIAFSICVVTNGVFESLDVSVSLQCTHSACGQSIGLQTELQNTKQKAMSPCQQNITNCSSQIKKTRRCSQQNTTKGGKGHFFVKSWQTNINPSAIILQSCVKRNKRKERWQNKRQMFLKPSK